MLNKFKRRAFCLFYPSFLACMLLLSEAAPAAPLKLGLIIPLTGPAALMGESLKGVVRISSLPSVAPIFEDDRCEGKSALSAYLKLRAEGVRVFYMACSGSILAAAPHAKRNADLILTTYAGSLRIRQTGDEVIRLNPDALSIAEAMRPLVPPAIRPAVILYEEQEYALSLTERLELLLEQGAVKRIPYRPDAASFDAEILSIKQAKARSLIFMPLADGAARTILRQLAHFRVNLPVIGEVNLCDYPFKLSDFGLRGSCVSARLSGPKYESFLAEYEEALKRPPAYPFYDALAYELLAFLNEITPADSGNANIEALKRKVLAGFHGMFGAYRFTPGGEIANSGEYLAPQEF